MSLRAEFALRRGSLELELELRCDSVTALMGPNGAGKSTALSAIVGALRPRRGWITLAGRTLFDAAARIHLPPEARGVAYVPQSYALFDHMSVIDNVRFAIAFGSRRAKTDRARSLLAELDLASTAGRSPLELSGGERQRVALARAMAAEPDLILLDEPLAALDVTVRPRVRRFLADWLWSTEVPALVVTHSAADARSYAADIVVLQEGKVVQSGSPERIAVRPASEFVAALTPGFISTGEPAQPSSSLSEDDEDELADDQ